MTEFCTFVFDSMQNKKNERSNHISWLYLFLFRWEWDWKENFSSQFVLITFASVIPAIFISCCFILGVMFLTSILQAIIQSLRFYLFTKLIAHRLSTIYKLLIDYQESKRNSLLVYYFDITLLILLFRFTYSHVFL